VRDPEISRAYYGITPREEERYDKYTVIPPAGKIGYRLHVALLTPAVPPAAGPRSRDGLTAAQRSLRYELLDRDGTIIFQSGMRQGSHYFWEPFTARLYVQADSDYNQVMSTSKGAHEVRVYGEPGTRYVLSVGDLEDFPPEELARLPATTRGLDQNYFLGPSPPRPAGATDATSTPNKGEMPSSVAEERSQNATKRMPSPMIAVAVAVALVLLFLVVGLLVTFGGRHAAPRMGIGRLVPQSISAEV
jgi:hypothetical protein